MTRKRMPYRVPIFSLSSLSDEPVRVITAYGFDRFGAYLDALEALAPGEFADESKVTRAGDLEAAIDEIAD